jgi:galactose-1-phosphate uridylyltransferase
VVYSTARSVRPHDHPEEEKAQAAGDPDCIICQGKTTGVIDVANLSEGFTFINKNLFPAFYPFGSEGVSGLHLLQWTSSFHEADWHNLTLQDASIVMSRLAALEGSLLEVNLSADVEGSRGFVSIFKNYGALVGSSLSHGHQQIMLTSVPPSSVGIHRIFHQEHGESFAEYLLRETPEELVVKDYGQAVLLVPDFMRRPYVMMLAIKDTQKSYLHELTADEIEAVAHGWHDATHSYQTLMPRIDKEIAYNILTHNGAGAGLYFEFLPYTQILGGLERMGLYICTELPDVAARRLSDVIGEGSRN